jgi:hypothetical protein
MGMAKSLLLWGISIIAAVFAVVAVYAEVIAPPTVPDGDDQALAVSNSDNIAHLCADIWSGKHKPYLAYEKWCATNKPFPDSASRSKEKTAQKQGVTVQSTRSHLTLAARGPHLRHSTHPTHAKYAPALMQGPRHLQGAAARPNHRS